MTVAVVGSRGIGMEYYSVLEQYLDKLKITRMVSGGAVGVDQMAERYAWTHEILMHVIKPRYHLYGRAAPLKRNNRIIARADFNVIFWDGKSRGSRYVIMTCEKANKPYFILRKDWKTESW